MQSRFDVELKDARQRADQQLKEMTGRADKLQEQS
jgi:hypothetical protein